jgi:hypothetical protein
VLQKSLHRELRGDYDLLLAAMNGAPPADANEVGCANALFVVKPYGFGACQTLKVQVQGAGGEVTAEHPKARDALIQGLRQGWDAAIQCLVRRASESGNDLRHLRAFSCRGSFPGIKDAEVELDGSSLGLAAAIAVLSSFLKVPVSASIAFTGAVTEPGVVTPVCGIDAKLTAARDKGVSRVYYPGGNQRDVDELSDEVKTALGLKPVSTIAEAAREVFPSDCVESAIARLRAIPFPSYVGKDLYAHADDGAERWLLTCVGGRDPYGPVHEEGPVWKEPRVTEEGPILAACRAVRPRRVFLFYTTGDSPKNNYGPRAQQLREVLREQDPGCDPQLKPLYGVTDPTNYEQLVPAMRGEIESIIRDSHAPTIYVSVSSGTPQMEHVWHMLIDAGLIPNARRLQVREGRHVPPGESRVRLVQVPALPQVRND